MNVGEILSFAATKKVRQVFGRMHDAHGHCVLGLLHLVIHDWSECEAMRCYSETDNLGDKSYQEVKEHLGYAIDETCPICKIKIDLPMILLIHMSDKHHWSFAQISQMCDW